MLSHSVPLSKVQGEGDWALQHISVAAVPRLLPHSLGARAPLAHGSARPFTWPGPTYSDRRRRRYGFWGVIALVLLFAFVVYFKVYR